MTLWEGDYHEKIKVKYVDWWPGFEAEKLYIDKILKNFFRVEYSDNPDYVIASVFGSEVKKYKCVRILYTGENVCPDFNKYDYGIGFEHLRFGDRYIRIPNFIMNLQYNAKQRFQSKYKFAIVFENSSHPGYLTEKLLGGFAAHTVPIYWGDPRVGECFDEKSFIQVWDNDLENAIERVKEADADDDLYLSYLRTPAFKDSEYREKCLNELKTFLIHIFSQPLEEAYQRNKFISV